MVEVENAVMLKSAKAPERLVGRAPRKFTISRALEATATV
jgi:hypothetical protein